MDEPYHRQRVKQKWRDILKYIEKAEKLFISIPSEVKYFEKILNSWPSYLPQLKNVVVKKGHWNIPNRWYLSGDGKTLVVFQAPFEIVIGQHNEIKASSIFLIKDIILLLVEAIQKENRSIKIHWDNNNNNNNNNNNYNDINNINDSDNDSD